MKRLGWLAFSLFGLILLQSCGGDTTVSTPPPPPPPPSAITVLVLPTNQVLDQGGTLTFSATVTGTDDKRVTWSVEEGPNFGTISAEGVYTAPARGGNVHIVAKSVADPSKTDIVPLHVNDISVFVKPTLSALRAGETKQFTATVYGTVLDTGVTWKLDDEGGAGTISATGLYTAPAAAGGPAYVIATSTSDPTKTSYGLVWTETREFQLVGDMILDRRNHTATLLPDGDVLIAGGAGQSGSPDPGAEIFQVSSNSFRTTNAMSEVRFGHTATMLPNGKVLIVGGQSAATCTQCSSKTAELFDPVTETFTSTGSMNTARSFHAAVLLLNGKVLVSGGVTNSASTSNGIEIYDPSTGQFSAAGTLTIGRSHHTATLLNNGVAFLAGGEGTNTIPFSADLYDATLQTSTQVFIAPRSRNAHTATLLPNGSVVLGGGGLVSNNYAYSQSHIFYSWNNTVSPDTQLITPRLYHTATLIDSFDDGRVLLAGGKSGSNASISSAELFDIGLFRPLLSMNRARSGHAATLLNNGKVLITGGAGDHSAEVY